MIGYLRVSTIDQDLDKNKAEILRLVNDKHLGSGHVVFVEEKASGKKPWRERRIAEIMDDLVEGDNLVVSEISRLGRSMLEIMEILTIATDKKIGVYVVKGDWELGVCAVGRLAPRKTGDVLPKVQPGILDGISGNGRFQIPASARFSIVRVRVLSRFPGINPPVAFASA